MWFVGLDIHWRMSVMCILGKNGKLVKTVTIRGPWPRVIDALREPRHPFAICYEASCGYGHLHDRLRRIARRVVVAWRRSCGAEDAEPVNGADPNLLYGAYVSDDAE